jgi:hypothetical protein
MHLLHAKEIRGEEKKKVHIPNKKILRGKISHKKRGSFQREPRITKIASRVTKIKKKHPFPADIISRPTETMVRKHSESQNIAKYRLPSVFTN